MSFMDAQFDRAVEIVQGLPKTGPVGVVVEFFDGHWFILLLQIQTDYEEKLTMYRYEIASSIRFCLWQEHFSSACTSKVYCPVLSVLAYHWSCQLATVGNVKSPRPAMWDMLGRAKWYAASSLISADSEHVPGMHGPNTRIWIHTKLNGFMLMPYWRYNHSYPYRDHSLMYSQRYCESTLTRRWPKI